MFICELDTVFTKAFYHVTNQDDKYPICNVSIIKLINDSVAYMGDERVIEMDTIQRVNHHLTSDEKYLQDKLTTNRGELVDYEMKKDSIIFHRRDQEQIVTFFGRLDKNNNLYITTKVDTIVVPAEKYVFLSLK